MAEPTAAEIAAFANLDQVAVWAQLPGAYGDLQTARGAFFSMVGANAGTHPRVLGVIAEAELAAVMPGYVIREPDPGGGAPVPPPRPPTLAETGACRQVVHVCRLVAGTASSAEAIAKATARAHDLAILQARAAKAPAPPANQVQLSLVVDQSLDRTVDPLPQADIDECFRRYRLVFGTDPPPKKEATVAQLTGMGTLLGEGMLPYADLAIWSANNNRIMKKIKLRGMVINSAGEFQPVELVGPPTFEAWEDGYGVLETALISHNAVDLGGIIGYHDHMKGLYTRFGKSAWALLYQADVRMRSEHMERIRRRGVRERAEALAAGGRHPFDPARPWHWVWEQAVLDTKFWKDEVEDPGLTVLTSAASVQKALGGDAPIAGAANKSAGASAPFQQLPFSSSSMALSPTQMLQEPPAGPPPKRKHHNVADGVYLTNRNNNPLCPTYASSGACPKDLVGVAKAGCADGLHQCNRCLSREHGRAACKAKTDPAAKTKSWGKSPGKGGGKGKWGR